MRKMSASQAAAFRKSLYAWAPVISGLLTTFGVVTEQQAAAVAGAIICTVTTTLAYFNTDPSLYSDKAPSSEASSEVE
jgi:hypothetical protein